MKAILSWRPDLVHLFLFVILVGGTTVRFVGVDFGLPLTIKSDEPIVVGGVTSMLERKSFEPDRFQWPNHLGIMATYLAVVFFTPLRYGISAEVAVTDLEIGYFHLVARSVTAIFGVVVIVLAYLIGKRFNRSIGLLSASLFAFLPLYVMESHYATPDIGLVMAVLAVVLAGMLYYEKPGTWRLVATAFLAAVAIIAKYPGALTTLIIATVVIAAVWRDRRWWRIVSHGALSLVTVPVSLFILSPALFTNRSRVIRQLGFESRGTHLGADGLSFTGKLDFYFTTYMQQTGWILLALAALGLVWLVWQKSVVALPLLIGVVFWLALSTLGLHWIRWSLPMFISPLFLSAIGSYAVVDFLKTRFSSQRWPWIVAVVGIGTILFSQVMSSVASSASFLRKDVRLIALEDFRNQGITPDNTAFEGYTPFEPGGFGVIFDDFEVVGDTLVPLNDKIQYVVLSDSMFGRYQAEDQYQEEQEFYRLVEENFTLIAEYQGDIPEVTVPLDNFRVMRAVRSIMQTAQGATDGPYLKVYQITN